MPTLEQLQKEIDDLNRLKNSLKRQYDGEVNTVKASLDMVKEAKDNYDKILKEATKYEK